MADLREAAAGLKTPHRRIVGTGGEPVASAATPGWASGRVNYRALQGRSSTLTKARARSAANSATVCPAPALTAAAAGPGRGPG